MTFYINPPEGTKEEWLATHALQEVRAIPGCFHYDETSDCALVCLVDNGPFTAAAVCYNNDEVQTFLHPDGRPKRWFIVPKRALLAPHAGYAGRDYLRKQWGIPREET